MCEEGEIAFSRTQRTNTLLSEYQTALRSSVLLEMDEIETVRRDTMLILRSFYIFSSHFGLLSLFYHFYKSG